MKFIIIFACLWPHMCFSKIAQDSALKRVSKVHSLENFKPNDLIKFESIVVSKRIVKDLKALLSAARKAGYNVKVISGYRSYKRQSRVFECFIAKELKKNPTWSKERAIKKVLTYSAQAGHSEHQLGTTVDILSSETNFEFRQSTSLKYERWLEINCPKYNFRMTYHKKQNEYMYEPWHLRWYPKK